VIRIPVEDVKRLGRATQGVIVMRLRGEERVSTLAPVIEQGNGESADDAQLGGEPSTEAVEPEARDSELSDEDGVAAE
jgi:hypothetical protein